MECTRVIVEIAGGSLHAVYGDYGEYLVVDFDNIEQGQAGPNPDNHAEWQRTEPMQAGLLACVKARDQEPTAPTHTVECSVRLSSSPFHALRAALAQGHWQSLRVAPVDQDEEGCRECAEEEAYLAAFWTIYGVNSAGYTYALADFTTRKLAILALTAAQAGRGVHRQGS